jgi:uncharacterized membrane protein
MIITIPSSNWKTTIAGLAGAILTVVLQYTSNGDQLNWKQLPVPITIALLGFLAKDFNTTGGTVQNSNNDPKVVAATAASQDVK